MYKLKKRFREINSYPTGPDSWIELIDNERCANETKKLIIDFFIWYETSNIQNTVLDKGLPQMGKSFDIKELGEELFNKFIDEYYK